MTWLESSVLTLLLFAVFGWLAADNFFLRRRIHRLQRMLELMASRIAQQSELLAKKAEKKSDDRFGVPAEQCGGGNGV